MKYPHVDPEKTIDRILSGLSEVEPPQGMQQRLLLAAKVHAREHPRATLRRALTFSHSFATLAACVCVAALVLCWTIAHHRDSTLETTHAPAPPTIAPDAIQPIAFTPVTPSRPPHSTRPAAAIASPAPPESANADDDLALSEMNAPSHPAPPMPLTEQEQFLLHMIHKGDPVELAMLDPKSRNSEFADSKAEFELFFKPPEPNRTSQTAPNNEAGTATNK